MADRDWLRRRIHERVDVAPAVEEHSLPDGTRVLHMLAAAPRTVLELAVLDVPGGDVVSSTPDLAGLSLVEQLVEVETRLDALDTSVIQERGLRLAPVRRIPWAAVREALLNAVVHRDWLSAETVHVTWVQADSALDVVSPGGFVGGVTAESVLSGRYARNPALADLARAMGLVERQGIGVDRMYREMVTLGHRPPLITEEPGPRVRTRLRGGPPLAAVVAVVDALQPEARRRDVRVAMTVYALLRDGFCTAGTLARLLQLPEGEAEAVVDVALGTTVSGEPLLRRSGSGPWLPARTLVSVATSDETALAAAVRRGLLRWHRPSGEAARRLVSAWLAHVDRITSGDLADAAGLTAQSALGLLNRLAAEGVVERGTASRGRNAHFVSPRPPTPVGTSTP